MKLTIKTWEDIITRDVICFSIPTDHIIKYFTENGNWIVHEIEPWSSIYKNKSHIFTSAIPKAKARSSIHNILH